MENISRRLILRILRKIVLHEDTEILSLISMIVNGLAPNAVSITIEIKMPPRTS